MPQAALVGRKDDQGRKDVAAFGITRLLEIIEMPMLSHGGDRGTKKIAKLFFDLGVQRDRATRERVDSARKPRNVAGKST
jgi:hypothetical protein